jgi:glycosyltransferase involved in cell wall biosynthesis
MLPLETPVVLCVTRLTEPNADGKQWKTEMVLALLGLLAPLLPKLLLVHVGDGPGRQQVERKIAELGCAERVRLAGRVDDEELVWYYAACDLFAHAGHRDCPWLAVLEAQGCGRPVVMMRTGSAELTVVPDRTGLLARSDDEFRSHVASLAFNRDRSAVFGSAAAEYIAQCHSSPVRLKYVEELLLGHRTMTGNV